VRLLKIPPETAEENLAFDESMLAQDKETLRFWESARPVVVIGHSGHIKEEVRSEACGADRVAILRRCSGGGAVVLGPGCLNYSLVFSLDDRPPWREVRRSHKQILGRMAKALDAECSGQSDLAWHGRKVSGNAQRRANGRLLHHGTLLYDFDAALAKRYLLEPKRQPAYRRHRPHDEFLGNLPYSANEIERRLIAVWKAS
jgi:lipoate---protein ligase